MNTEKRENPEPVFPRISIITVVFNAADSIEETLQSVLGQTWKNIEYLVIDGGSTDGTIDIIEKYREHINYWISEPDKGIFDALNKGIDAATGDLIGLLNSGDLFAKKTTVEELFREDTSAYDVVYGNSMAVDPDGNIIYSAATAPLNSMWKFAVYRHGASFVKSEVHKKLKFSLDKKLGFSSDFDHIYFLYFNNYKFLYRDVDVVKFREEGISHDRLKNIIYNFKIVTKYEGIKFKIILFYFYLLIRYLITKNKKIKSILFYFMSFFTHYLPNHVINVTPFYCIRHFYYRYVLRMKLGKGSSIHMNTFIMKGDKIRIGKGTTINRQCMLDARGGIEIGDNVTIAPRVSLVTAEHDVQSENFAGRTLKIEIGDYAFIGINATILPGVRIGRGAVICAGAVVTSDIGEFTIAGGVPARQIGKRNETLNYSCKWFPPFD